MTHPAARSSATTTPRMAKLRARLVEHPDTPLERGGDVVVAVLELKAEHVLRGPADHVQVTEPGELARSAARPDEAPLLVEDEEGGVGGRVVVVQELEQEPEAALLASLGSRLEAGGALCGLAAVAAVRAD